MAKKADKAASAPKEEIRAPIQRSIPSKRRKNTGSTIKPDSLTPGTIAVDVLRSFEAGYTREKIVETLSQAPDMSFEEERFLNILADPRSDLNRIDTICRRLNFPVGKFFNFLKRARGTEALLKAMDQVWSKMPLVAKDVMDRSIPHKLPCRVCFGSGEVENGKGAKKCKDCNGTGFTEHLPDLERQKVALQMGGLLKSDTKIQSNTQVNVGFQVLRSDAEFRAATDKLLFAGNPAPEESDVVAEVMEESE